MSTGVLYYLCNSYVNLKLFQNKMFKNAPNRMGYLRYGGGTKM